MTQRDVDQLERVIVRLEIWQNSCKDAVLTEGANKPKEQLMRILELAQAKVGK